jgi:integrase
MGIYKKGNIYWMIKQYMGKKVERSLDTSNKRVAEARHAKIVSEIIDGSYFKNEKAKTITFKEMTEKYTAKYRRLRDETSLKKLVPAFGHLMLVDVTTELVSDYRDKRLKIVKPATVYQELALMRRMFNVARREWKWTKDNPVADLSFSVGNKNARDRWLTIEEEQKVISKATNPVWLRPLLLTALHTGMRRGEILNLKRQDIDFSRRILTVHKSKNGEKRSIPLSQTLYNTLNDIKVINISGRVFPMSVRSLRAAFDMTLKKIGIKDFHFHDLRHTFATRLVQKGVDLYKVKELLGHKSISVTMRYAHHYPESLRASVEVLDKDYYNFTTMEVRSN